MKKLKRTLSLTLVAAMVLGTFGISAMATDGDDTAAENPSSETEQTSTSGKKEITSLKVTKKIECTQNVSLPTETFTVTMVPATGSDLFVPELDKDGNAVKDDQGNVKTTNKVSGVTVQSGPELADNDVTFTVDSSTNTSNPNGVTLTEDLSLALKTGEAFTESGIYRYVVTETIPTTATTVDGITSNGYVVYDTQKYTVDLYVNRTTTRTSISMIPSCTARTQPNPPTSNLPIRSTPQR
jgi:hypothetical protein